MVAIEGTIDLNDLSKLGPGEFRRFRFPDKKGKQE